MSEPIEFDLGNLKLGDGALTEVFTTICGITAVTINETIQTAQRAVRDCAKPNKPGTNKSRIISYAWTATATGLTNTGDVVALKSALGKVRNMKFEVLGDDGTDAGELLGTWAGKGILTARNYSIQNEADSSMELTVEGQGDLVYTVAP